MAKTKRGSPSRGEPVQPAAKRARKQTAKAADMQPAPTSSSAMEKMLQQINEQLMDQKKSQEAQNAQLNARIDALSKEKEPVKEAAGNEDSGDLEPVADNFRPLPTPDESDGHYDTGVVAVGSTLVSSLRAAITEGKFVSFPALLKNAETRAHAFFSANPEGVIKQLEAPPVPVSKRPMKLPKWVTAWNIYSTVLIQHNKKCDFQAKMASEVTGLDS